MLESKFRVSLASFTWLPRMKTSSNKCCSSSRSTRKWIWYSPVGWEWRHQRAWNPLFTINMDDGKTLGFSGDETVRYADVTSSGEGMTMLVGIIDRPNPSIGPPLMILKNRGRYYPICGVQTMCLLCVTEPEQRDGWRRELWRTGLAI